MKLGVLFTGGKDSCYAMYKASKTDKVVVLISLISKNKDSYMFHTPIDSIDRQASKLGLSLIKVETEGRKEEELEDLKKAIEIGIEKYKIEGVVSGAVASTYQSSRIQKICDELDVYCFNPLWQMDQEKLLRELVENDFKVKIIKVAADGLDDRWIGRIIDNEVIEELLKLKEKYGINISFEGGEAETEVIEFPNDITN